MPLSVQPSASSVLKSLDQIPVTQLSGVGPALAQKLQKLHIHHCADLVFYLPLRYEDRTRVTCVRDAKAHDVTQLEVEVIQTQVQFGKRRSLVVHVEDDTGSLSLRFFHFNQAMQQRFQDGGRLRLFGEIRYGRSGLEMVHPELRWLNETPTPLTQTLTPVYPVTEGLSQIGLRKLIQQVLKWLTPDRLPELLPAHLPHRQRLPDLVQALHTVHSPPASIDADSLLSGQHPALQRLALEELVAHQLSFLQLREKIRLQAAEILPPAMPLEWAFMAQLPFSLTSAQQRVLQVIYNDLSQPSPMQRLVQGDVGSGKTVVAALAALRAVAAGKQVVLMAPTELLAEQHFQNFCRWFDPLKICCAFLAGKTKGKQRDAVLQSIANNDVSIVIGTHALFQESVHFSALALAIIDEQHRFGVQQRLALRDKGVQQQGHFVPHQLVMTATPIPRTLAMTAYADLDSSVIDELPPGRTPITTVAIANQRRDEVIDRVQNAVREKRQVYWVCTLIEETDLLQAQAAEAAFRLLQEQLTNVRVALVHGRLKAAEKQQLMAAFKAHDIDVLVATTVIEVGVDVPNASLMIIENAERLGLAQLHQLRGRVGRGSAQSHCVLLYQAPLSAFAQQRLQVMRETGDGFVIAEKDLQLRGPGELLGTRQTGAMAFKIADIARDQRLVPVAQQWAKQLLQEQDVVVAPLMRRWLVGRSAYGQV